MLLLLQKHLKGLAINRHGLFYEWYGLLKEFPKSRGSMGTQQIHSSFQKKKGNWEIEDNSHDTYQDEFFSIVK